MGKLGDGSITDSSVPKLIDSGYSSISASNSTFGIKSDGSLWGWGWNGNGQLGDGTHEDKLTPTRIYVDE